MSGTISLTVNFGWLPWQTRKTVYPRCRKGMYRAGPKNPASTLDMSETNPPLTTKITPAPFGWAGFRTSSVRAIPNLWP